MSQKKNKTEQPSQGVERKVKASVAIGFGWWKTFALCMLSTVLLVPCFAPFGIWPLAYIAIVPWLIGVTKARSTRVAIIASFISGLVLWSANVFWLVMPTPVGYAGTVAYTSLYWIFLGWAMRGIGRGKLPVWLMLPIVWVSVEFIRAHVVSFAWFFLAQTQYRLPVLLQVSDITGQYGVSFFVAMVNGLVASAMLKKTKRSLIAGVITIIIVLIFMLGYGWWRMSQKTQSPGPRVGIVQQAIPINLAGRGYTAWEIMNRHLAATAELAGQNCDVILWPETMLPNGMNDETINAKVEEFTPKQIKSMSCFIWSVKTAKRYSSDELRKYLRAEIGPLSDQQSNSLGVKYVLLNYITPDIFASLNEKQINELALQLLGQEKYEKLSPKLRKSAVGVFILGIPAESFDKKDLAKLLKLYSELPLDDLDIYTYVAVCRFKIASTPLGIGSGGKEMLKVQVAMMRAMSTITGCPIFAGGATGKANTNQIVDNDYWLQSNSVISFGNDQQQIYSKTHLVPFSEYVICKDSCLPFYKFLRMFIPEVMPQLEPGREYTRFNITSQSGSEKWQMVTPICFEGTFGRVCREMVADGEKSQLIMANFSNDGWFTLPSGDKHIKSTEQSQHLVHYIFRAIENRVPVVRAVNTGISAAVDSCGRVYYTPEPDKPGDATMLISESAAVNTLVDSRITMYSLYGDFFAKTVLAACVLYILGRLVLGLFKARSENRNKKQYENQAN